MIQKQPTPSAILWETMKAAIDLDGHPLVLDRTEFNDFKVRFEIEMNQACDDDIVEFWYYGKTYTVVKREAQIMNELKEQMENHEVMELRKEVISGLLTFNGVGTGTKELIKSADAIVNYIQNGITP